MIARVQETHRIPKQARSSGHSSQSEEGGQSCILALKLIRIFGMETNRDSKGANQHLSSQPAHFLFRLAANARDDGIVSAPCSSMVQCIAAHQEDLSELFIVVGHHCRTRRLLGHREQVVHVLDGPESLLP